MHMGRLCAQGPSSTCRAIPYRGKDRNEKDEEKRAGGREGYVHLHKDVGSDYESQRGR